MNKYDIEYERAHKVFEDAGNSEFTLKWVVNFIEEWELWTGIIKNHRSRNNGKQFKSKVKEIMS